MGIPESFFYNRNAPVEYWNRDLPHLSQAGKIQFVTFHLGDSLPQVAQDEISYMRRNFLSQHPEPWTKEIKIKYSRLISPKIESYLDAGYGSCIFRMKEYRDILSQKLNHGHPNDYDLRAYVIMPNHVHLLATEYEEKTLKRHIGNVRRFSAADINKLLGRKGSLWDKEPFNRFVRNEVHYYNCLYYIMNNPRFLPSDQYELGGWEIEWRLRNGSSIGSSSGAHFP